MKIKLLLVLLFCISPFINSYSQQDVNGWYWLNGKPTGSSLNWVKVFDAANIYAIGARGTFIKTSDGGDNWSVNSQVGSIYPGPDGHRQTLPLNTGWFFNANTGIVAGQSVSSSTGTISRTTNGGNTWSYIQYSAIGGTVKGMHFINSTTGYITGNTNAKLYKTTDAGLTWNSISGVIGFPVDDFSSVYAIDADNIYLTSNTSKKVYNYKTSTGWTTYTLPGVGVLMKDIVFKDVNTGYVSGMNNYFAYTTNAGISWNLSNVPSANNQYNLVYNGGMLYSAGDYTNIYKSSDNGVTWSSVYFYDASNPNQPQNPIIYGLDINGSNMAAVGGDGFINISNDGGSTWRNKNYSVTNNYGAKMYSSIYVQTTGASSSPVVGNIWLGPSEGGNILFSSNAGTNWTTKPTPNVSSVKVIQFVNASTGYICGGNSFQGIGEMSKTTNGGNTWTALSLPSPVNGLANTAMYFVNANTGWVATEGGYCVKTTNGGASWTAQTLETSTIYSVRNLQMIDANTGYAIASSLYKTTNGGTNWIKTTNPYILAGSWNDFYLMSKDIIFISGPGMTNKISRSVDGGNTWTDITSNLYSESGLWKSKWINLKHGVVSAAGGYMAKTTNGGLSWTESNTGGSSAVDLSFPNKNEWYTISDRNGAFPAFRKYDNITSLSFNITMGIEGFWNGSSMTPDTVIVELRNSVSPYNKIEQSKEFVSPYGFATYEFYTAPAGSYYIILKHRNSLETWSSVPVTVVAAGNYNYNFTTSASQSFGSNSILKAGVYCVYSGDVNQDQTIDASDLASVENAIDFSGYLPEDLTGDDYIDAADLSIVENNQGMSFVSP